MKLSVLLLLLCGVHMFGWCWWRERGVWMCWWCERGVWLCGCAGGVRGDPHGCAGGV